jgi:hypothetical protein
MNALEEVKAIEFSYRDAYADGFKAALELIKFYLSAGHDPVENLERYIKESEL